MKTVKDIWRMVSYNFKSLVLFELIFKVLSLLVFVPLFVNSFDLIMRLTGYKYLTLENVWAFLSNPLTVILIVILILIMTVYSMFDITNIIIILDSSYHKKKIKVIDAIRLSIIKCKKVFNYKNIPLAIMVLFIIPFLHIGIGSSFISAINIPEFINDYIMQNITFIIIFALIIIFLVIVLLRWLYSLHYYVLEDVSFREARKKSINLGNNIMDLITLIIIQVVYSVFYIVFIVLGILIIILIDKALKVLLLKSILTTIIWFFIALSFVVFGLLATPISYAGISSLYYFRKNKNQEKINHIKVTPSKEHKRIDTILKKCVVGIALIAFLIGILFTYGVYKGDYNLNIEYLRQVEVTAHRGSSLDYPENTMSAFKGAKEKGAEWIELDVQQIKDGSLIVMHDTNLKRTANLNKNTWEVTYEEIKNLDNGSFLDSKFNSERIPLLKDVIVWAKANNMKLNIELKPTGKENDFEKNVIDLIKELNFEEDSIIASQIYSVIENVKAYDKNIKTVYVMSLAYGNILEFDKADHFSIEATNVTKKLVSEIHNAGKELYVWTINNEETIKKMLDYNVDNIITDDITLTKDIIMSSKTSNVINEYIKYVSNLLA
ncbi:MAG: glycerophosphoryl diester phosphodiesterase membrane domain-containing protein [Ruminococcus sp.]|nr:glycerophosphoryl diester phosphodiesterase membrane domain-containing protein [Ruminococcus sp.]